MAEIQVKGTGEIKDKLRDLLHRARERYVKQGLLPTPKNCAHAVRIPGKPPLPCPRCQAEPGKACRLEFEFQPRYVRRELETMFKEKANNVEWLAREARDVYMLLWVLGQVGADLDMDQELVEGPSPLPPTLTEGSLVRMTTSPDGSVVLRPVRS